MVSCIICGFQASFSEVSPISDTHESCIEEVAGSILSFLTQTFSAENLHSELPQFSLQEVRSALTLENVASKIHTLFSTMLLKVQQEVVETHHVNLSEYYHAFGSEPLTSLFRRSLQTSMTAVILQKTLLLEQIVINARIRRNYAALIASIPTTSITTPADLSWPYETIAPNLPRG